ncbi:dynein regulatory complex subunit 4 [Musca domestica]|uniref:Dynein regulatory complex subunit 4 n=1 Tax=Musca domestica TaxID=7370 RepID=A0A9J7CY57_MUSDO|nr:dynein regulatory complex subunit 4 [Musca domestica]
MPPKPKKGKKGKAKPTLIDGVDTSNMSRDQLEAFALRLKTEMEREREERNFFQMERDKIRTFWEITRGQLEETTTELRQKDHEVEMTQQAADIDAKQIMQQMKHLQFENQNKISEVRAEAMTQLKMAQEDHETQEMQLLSDLRELKRLRREDQEMHELQIQELKMKHIEEITELRTKFEKETKDLTLLHEEKMHDLKNEIELIYRMQMFEVEERKNLQIQKLIENHDMAFNDMKNYYNDITLNNLGLISSLKEQMETLRKQAERSDRLANDMANENRKLKEPLEQAQQELVVMKRKLEFYDRDKAQLSRLKTRNAQVEKQLKALTWETEALLLRNDTLVKEREELKEKFEDVVIELQQKTGLKNVLLERKIAIMEREGEKQEIMLKETLDTCAAVVKSVGKDIESPVELERRVENVLDEKNKLIQELRYELARLTKAHDDLLATYEAKLLQYGIPKEELGFEPLRSTSKWSYLLGPAGLVTKNP